MFTDRAQAARLIADRLRPYRAAHPLVLAIPRGAVPMASIIAESLEGDMDVVLVRKLAFPGNPEFAIGAVDEEGNVTMNEHLPDYGISDDYIARERDKQLGVIRERRALYTSVRPGIDPSGRTVIIVDDGTATGATMIAALHAIRKRHPARLIAAMAVASPDALREINTAADETVCLSAPDYFMAVAQFFENFSEVTDQDVIRIFSERGSGASSSPPPPAPPGRRSHTAPR